jgi:hypothetical protein
MVWGMGLEQQKFARRTADFVWMIMLGMLTLLMLTPLLQPLVQLIIPGLQVGPPTAC